VLPDDEQSADRYAGRLYTYADGSVFCGDMQLEAGQTATNPVLLVEVLSPSTQDYDRGEKLDRYRSIPSLRHVLLIEQATVDVEHWFRTPEGWRRRVHTDVNDSIHLDAFGIDLPLRDLYDGAERFPAARSDPP
jgi:Uma2 family endonuclease